MNDKPGARREASIGNGGCMRTRKEGFTAYSAGRIENGLLGYVRGYEGNAIVSIGIILTKTSWLSSFTTGYAWLGGLRKCITRAAAE